MQTEPAHHIPVMSQSGLEAAVSVMAQDEYGEPRSGYIANERALTVYLDKREVLTLMTMGTAPELLILGWLRNQRLLSDIAQIKAIQVDWETESAVVTTFGGIQGLDAKLEHKTVTTGCGQGTVFGGLMDNLDKIHIPQTTVSQALIYQLLHNLNEHNDVYKRAGGVHGCALCQGDTILHFVEDVGRHNAVDTIAGHMWLHNATGENKIFYTTGRLTSEMVIKVAQMGIPILLSRSGVTQMGLDLARKVGVTLIARAKGHHFLVYNGSELIQYDAIPQRHTRLETSTI